MSSPGPGVLLLALALHPVRGFNVNVVVSHHHRLVTLSAMQPLLAPHDDLIPKRSKPLAKIRAFSPRCVLAPTTLSTFAQSLDAPLGILAWCLIAVYNIVSRRFQSQWTSQNADGRAVWCRYILEKGDCKARLCRWLSNTHEGFTLLLLLLKGCFVSPDADILGVQTLRNALTSASFFASACFTSLSLVVGLGLRDPATLSTLSMVKYSSTAILLVGAALSYLQSVRYMNTCAFLFQVANDQRDTTCSRGTVMLLMVLSQNCWAAGEKMLYLMVPSAVWLVGGGVPMLLVTLLMLPVLYYKDLPAPTNLLGENEPSLVPYEYLLAGRLRWLDFFGFSTALRVAQETVAKSGDYAKEKCARAISSAATTSSIPRTHSTFMSRSLHLLNASLASRLPAMCCVFSLQQMGSSLRHGLPSQRQSLKHQQHTKGSDERTTTPRRSAQSTRT